jgi:tRNA G18 (ribose-2'-O)-methylase SpoU
MGAHFQLPICQHVAWAEISTALSEITLVASDARRGEDLRTFQWPERTALTVGSEATGLSGEAEGSVAQYVRIPIVQGVESLNAAVAASILLYAGLVSTISGES